MKKILKFILLFLLLFSSFSSINYTNALEPSDDVGNLRTGVNLGTNSSINNNSPLKQLKNPNTDYTIANGGQRGLVSSIIRIARDLKNLFFLIAGIYLLIAVLKVIFGDKTDEEVTKFKKAILWISIGIIVTQLAYYIVNILYDREVNSNLADNFISLIIWPLIELIETVASFVFLAVMIYAFYRIVTAGGNEEQIKTGKMSVVGAIIGFIVIKLSKAIVSTVYGRTNCSDNSNIRCIHETDLTAAGGVIVRVIDWLNGFVGIIVIIMIIYAGFLVLTSFGDEEKLKKAKSIIIYIAIGLFVLIANYLILTFFILPESKII